jgi:hypothetical protein
MISSIDSDALEPLNLHDWELSDETTVLPASRPLAELTSTTYLIVKGRMMRALGRITDFNNALESRSYDKVLELDRSLEEAYQSVPAHMKMQMVEPEILRRTSASTVSALQMDFMYHQGLCVLHRRFLGKGRLDRRYSLSLDRCISSALVLLAQQDTVHRITRSQSRGSMPYWYNVSNARHFFVVATMVLCIFMGFRRRGEDIGATPEQKTLLQALERSCEIWKDVQDSSDEVKRIYPGLSSMLFSLKKFATASSSLPSEAPAATLESSGTWDQTIQSTNSTAAFPDKSISSEMDIDWVGSLLFPSLPPFILTCFRLRGIHLSKASILMMASIPWHSTKPISVVSVQPRTKLE